MAKNEEKSKGKKKEGIISQSETKKSEMNRTSMDLRSISCKGIKCFNLFQKPSIYAVISVIDPSNPSRHQKKKTAVDSDGGENPEWTETFRFDLDGRDLALEIDLMVHGNLLLFLGERVVGKVHVPIANLLKEGSDGSVRHVSYRVVGTDGKPNGEIRFSYNINYPAAVTVPAGGYCPPPPYQLDSVVPSPPGSYYPLQDSVVPRTAAVFFPPPGQQYPVDSSRAIGFYHPPRLQYPAVPSPESDFYPPPRHQEPVNAFPAAGGYPPPRQYPSPVSANYPPQYQQEPVVCYPPPPTVVGNYPPPSAPLACCYPPPPPPPPQNEGYGYRPEIWDRRPYG